jgi:hypothetical protein
MTTVKNLLLVVSVFACVCTVAMAGDLQFDANSIVVQWTGKGPIVPTHIAILSIAHVPVIDNSEVPSDNWMITRVLATSAGKLLSQQQKDLLVTGQSVWWGTRDNAKTPHIDVPNHLQCNIGAVGEDDARKMAQAVVEALTKGAASKLEYAEKQMDDLQRRKAVAEEKLKEKEAAIAKIPTKLAPDEIRKTIVSLEETKNSLLIDIAGMKAKIAAIRETLADKGISNEIRAKLQQELFDQNIALASALAKLETANKICAEAEAKYNDSCQLAEFQKAASGWKLELSNVNSQFSANKQSYDKMYSEIVWPQVFQNKVTIYPVSVDKKVQK